MALNNMSGIGINININVNAPGATQATNQVTQGLNQVANAGARAVKQVGQFKQQFQQLAGEYNKMVVGEHLIGAVMGLVSATDEISQGMAKVKMAMSDAFDPAAANHLRDVMMNVAETTGARFKDLADMTHELLSQGVSSANVEAILSPLTKFMTIRDISAENATKLTMALSNMGIAGKQAGEALDVIQNLTLKTPIRAPEFVDILIKAAPAATLAKQSFLELASTAALLRTSFTGGKDEGSALLQTISKLEVPKTQAKLKGAFGIDVMANKATGELKPMLTIINDVKKAIEGGHGSISDLATIFGTRSGFRVFAGGLQTLRSGMDLEGKHRTGQDLIDTMRETTGKSKGAVDVGFGVRMETFGAQVDRLRAAFTDLLADSGGKLVDSLTAIVKGVTDLVQGFHALITFAPWIKALFQIIISTGGKMVLLAGGFLVVSAGVKIASAAFAGLRTSLFGVAIAGNVAATAAKGFWRSLLGPIGIALTIVSLVSDIFGLFKEGEKAQDKSLSVADSLKQTSFANQNAADKLMSAAEALFEASEIYKELVVEYSKGLVTNFPSFDKGKALPAIATAVKDAAATGLITPEAAKVMGDQILQLFSGKPLAGEEGTKTLNEAARALQVLGSAAAAAAAEHKPGAAAAVKVFDDMLKTFEAMTKKPMVQFTTDVGTLSTGVNPTTTQPTELPHLRRQHQLLNWVNAPPTGGTTGKPLFDPKFREHLEQTHQSSFGNFDARALEVGQGLSIKDHKVIVDVPVQLSVDGTQVGGTLRMNRKQQDVEELQSP